MSEELSAERVVAASAAWLFVPEDATRLETADYLLACYPDYYPEPAELLRCTPAGSPEQAFAEVLARAADLGLDRLMWWVKPDSPPPIETLVRDRGGVLDETLDILALDLARRTPSPPDPAVELRWQTDLETVRDASTVAVRVFGGDLPPQERMAAVAAQSLQSSGAGFGGTVVAYVDGRLAGAAGLSVVPGVARLWGGAVIEEFRRHGVYRELLAARLDYATNAGATLALVKARVDSSAPILRRLGFTAYGQECSYRLPLTPPAES